MIFPLRCEHPPAFYPQDSRLRCSTAAPSKRLRRSRRSRLVPLTECFEATEPPYALEDRKCSAKAEPNVRALSLEAWAQMGPHRSPSTTQAAALVLDGPSRLYLTEGPNFSQVQL